MKYNITYGKQSISDEDIAAVIEVLKSDFLTQGPKVEEFEKAIAEYCNTKYAIAFSNGTTALHAAYACLGIEEGDEVIVPDITFVGSANGAVYCGGQPVLCDIDMETYCIDIDAIEALITPKTKVITPVSFGGYPVDLEKIKKIADKHNLKILHDAAHAIGARRNGKPNFAPADFNLLSFHPVKHVTTGEGGMLLTDDEQLAKAARLFRTHGITKDPNEMENYEGGWSYDMIGIGNNYRLNDMQCAMGISQFKRINENLLNRNLIAKRYNEAFANNPKIIVPPHFDLSHINEDTDVESLDVLHAYHLYLFRVTEDVDRKDMFDYLKSKGIMVQVHYIPINTFKYYREHLGYEGSYYPNSSEFYNSEISLPMYHSLSEDEQEYVIKTVLDYLESGK